MNEVVKTLTIISTIFIPLTFISGVYGMVTIDFSFRIFSQYSKVSLVTISVIFAILYFYYYTIVLYKKQKTSQLGSFLRD